MQVFVELLAAAVVATAAAALSWFGVEITPSEKPVATRFIGKTPVQTNMIVVTPPARRTQAIPC